MERVGLDDNFFESGGTLAAGHAAGEPDRAMLGVELPIRTCSSRPRWGTELPRLRDGRETDEAGAWEQRPKRVPLSYAQQRLWFIDRLEGTSTEYNVPQHCG